MSCDHDSVIEHTQLSQEYSAIYADPDSTPSSRIELAAPLLPRLYESLLRYVQHSSKCTKCTPNLRLQTLSKRYLLTFTTRPDARDSIDAFQKAVEHQLSRAAFLSASYSIEHPETNLHAHAIVHSNRYLQGNKDFAVFTKHYGHVDVKAIRIDNGVEAYIGKESPIFDRDASNTFIERKS